MTHYQTLEIAPAADAAAIRTAYRRLVLLTHPDRTPDPAAHARYLAVNAAYEVLADPARRQAYDHSLRVEPFTVEDSPPAETPAWGPGRRREEARRRAPARPAGRVVPNTVLFARQYALTLKWARPFVILALVFAASAGADVLLATESVEQVTDYERLVYYTGGGRYSSGRAHRYYRHFTARGTFDADDQVPDGARVIVSRTPIWHQAMAVFTYPEKQPIQGQGHFLATALFLVLTLAAGFALVPTFNADHRLMAVFVLAAALVLILLLL